MKITANLNSSSDAPYASDVASRSYEVINHRKGEATKFEFSMNAALQTSKVTAVSKTEIPRTLI